MKIRSNDAPTECGYLDLFGNHCARGKKKNTTNTFRFVLSVGKYVGTKDHVDMPQV